MTSRVAKTIKAQIKRNSSKNYDFKHAYRSAKQLWKETPWNKRHELVF